MDTASTLIGIGLLALFIAPVAYLLINETLKNRSIKKQFLQLSKEHNLQFTQTEFLSDLSLGLDEMSRKLLILISRKTPQILCIDLHKIGSVKVENKYYEENPAKNTQDEVHEITLDLKSKDHISEENTIIFYRQDFNSVLQKESRMNSAIKWKLAIENTLKK